MKNKLEIANEILEHMTKFEQNHDYKRECRENQFKEIQEMMEKKIQDSDHRIIRA